MKDRHHELERLRRESEELRLRLQEARETLAAIHGGEVDALVVRGSQGEQIFTLKGADNTYRALIEEMRGGAITLAQDGSILYANRFIETILATPLEKIIGSSIELFVHPQDAPALQAVVKQSGQHHAGVELRLTADGGRLVCVYLSATRIVLEDVPVCCLAVTDLTDQKRHEHILAEERLSRSIIDQSADAIVVCNEQGIVIRASEVVWDLIGRSCLEEPFNEIFDIRINSGDPAQPGPVAEYTPFLIDHIIAGRSFRSREALIEEPGLPATHLLLSATPLSDNSGAVIGAIVNLADITAKIRLEHQLKESREGLRESNRELNEYAYALTHNLKAPFRAVQNYTEFLSEDLGGTLQGEPKQFLEGIKRAVTQANKQFEDLEALYSIKNRSVRIESFDMQELLDEMKYLFKSDTCRKLIIAEQWPTLRCEKFLLRQILIDLITNGFKYNRADNPTVEVGWRPATGGRFEIFIRDSGIGIDPRYHEQIFGIFKRLHTDREYAGTGIGLAIVKKAVQKIGATVRVESAVGEGSTFYIALPNSILEAQPPAPGKK